MDCGSPGSMPSTPLTLLTRPAAHSFAFDPSVEHKMTWMFCLTTALGDGGVTATRGTLQTVQQDLKGRQTRLADERRGCKAVQIRYGSSNPACARLVSVISAIQFK